MNNNDFGLIQEWMSFLFLPSITGIFVVAFTIVIWGLNKSYAILFFIAGIIVIILEFFSLLGRTADRFNI